MIKCDQATRLASERLERRLSPAERLQLRLHTAMCSACRRFQQQAGQLRQFAGQYRHQLTADNAAPGQRNDADTEKKS